MSVKACRDKPIQTKMFPSYHAKKLQMGHEVYYSSIPVHTVICTAMAFGRYRGTALTLHAIYRSIRQPAPNINNEHMRAWPHQAIREAMEAISLSTATTSVQAKKGEDSTGMHVSRTYPLPPSLFLTHNKYCTN